VVEPVKDRSIGRNFDCQVSLPRLPSAGSSYSRSLLFSEELFLLSSSPVKSDVRERERIEGDEGKSGRKFIKNTRDAHMTR